VGAVCNCSHKDKYLLIPAWYDLAVDGARPDSK